MHCTNKLHFNFIVKKTPKKLKSFWRLKADVCFGRQKLQLKWNEFKHVLSLKDLFSIFRCIFLSVKISDIIIFSGNTFKSLFFPTECRKKSSLSFCFLLHLCKNIIIIYTEILTRKVVLCCFFKSETSGKIHNSTFQVKISV